MEPINFNEANTVYGKVQENLYKALCGHLQQSTTSSIHVN